MLETRALEIWDAVDAADYDWPVSDKALKRLGELLQKPVVVEEGESSDALNRRLRSTVSAALRTRGASTADLYEWIVCNWGGVWAGRQEVRDWAELDWLGATPENGGSPAEKMMQFANQSGAKRISSWSKIFAHAEPDQHAIYDSRVAVALNIALHRIGEGARFHMPESKVYRPKEGPPRPNAVARARKAFGRHASFGYPDYLVWARAVQTQLAANGRERPDLLAIESRLFSAAPPMADQYLRSLT